MKVARLHGPGHIVLHDEADPVPHDGEELVEVNAVGLCGSDLHWFSDGAIGDAGLAGRPLVIGHEFAGTILGGPRDGVAVAVDPAVPCRACRFCHAGEENLCSQLIFAGHGGQDGALRELLSWPGHLLHPLPAGLTATEGALLEPLGVALHAMDLSHLRMGTTVAVVGCGPIGLLVLQLARLAGAARVIAVEPLEHRRRMATRLGADKVVAPTEVTGDLESVAEHVYEVTNRGDSLDVCLRMARPGARVILVGIPEGDRSTFRASLARRKGLTLALVRRMKATYPRAIALVASGKVDVASLVTQVEPLDNIGQAMADAATRSGIKVLVEPRTRS